MVVSLPGFILPFCLVLDQPGSLLMCHGRHVYTEVDLAWMVDSRKPGVTEIEGETMHLRFPVRRWFQIDAHHRTDHILVGFDSGLFERKLEESSMFMHICGGQKSNHEQSPIQLLVEATREQEIAGLVEVLFHYRLCIFLGKVANDFNRDAHNNPPLLLNP